MLPFAHRVSLFRLNPDMNTSPMIGLSCFDRSGLWMSVFSFPSGVFGSLRATILALSLPPLSKISKVASSVFQGPVGEDVSAARILFAPHAQHAKISKERP